MQRLSHFFLFMFIFIVFLSCKNKEVTQDVQRYCACLTDNKTNPDGRETCFEMMDEIKAKYAGDNRALLQILDETENCL
jgi:hypothetical protein